jgi:putative transposase
VDDVYALIARNRLYADLYTTWLKDHQHLPLYLDRPTAEAHALLRTQQGSAPFGRMEGAHLTTLYANAPLDWDGKRWTLLNLGETTTTLLPEEGTLIQLETPVFLHLVDTHEIQVRDTSQSAAMALSEEVHRLLTEAGPEALDVANQRYRLVEAYRKPPHAAIGRPKLPKKAAVSLPKRFRSCMLAPNNRKPARSLWPTSAPACNNTSSLSRSGLFIGM